MDLGHIAVVQAEFVREKPHVVGVKVPEKHYARKATSATSCSWNTNFISDFFMAFPRVVVCVQDVRVQ